MCCAVLYSNVLYCTRPLPPGRTLASGHPRTLAALRPPAVTPRPTQDDPSLSICPRPGGQPRCHGATVPRCLGSSAHCGPPGPSKVGQVRPGSQARLGSAPPWLARPLALSLEMDPLLRPVLHGCHCTFFLFTCVSLFVLLANWCSYSVLVRMAVFGIFNVPP